MNYHIETYKKEVENANSNNFNVLYYIGYARLFRCSQVVERSVLKCRNVWKSI